MATGSSSSPTLEVAAEGEIEQGPQGWFPGQGDAVDIVADVVVAPADKAAQAVVDTVDLLSWNE